MLTCNCGRTEQNAGGWFICKKTKETVCYYCCSECTFHRKISGLVICQYIDAAELIRKKTQRERELMQQSERVNHNMIIREQERRRMRREFNERKKAEAK